MLDEGSARLATMLREKGIEPGDRNFTLEAHDDGERVSGTVRYVETLRHGAHPPYVCESGAVTFFAGD